MATGSEGGPGTDRVLSFDLNAAQVGHAHPHSAPRPVAPAPIPDRNRARAEARAELCAAYGAVLGCDLSVPDLVEDLLQVLRADAETSSLIVPAHLATLLQHAGLDAQVARVATPGPSHWPALALMSNGQMVLVLGQDGSTLFLHDTTCRDQRAEVPVAEFAPYYAGEILRARVTQAQLETRHGGAAARKHWFWGAFATQRRAFAEVAFGSLFANLLAVAVALFSLQVYDRVIPHQSESTLWVLALGAGLALVLEMALKLARSGLMDLAGRRIELGTQRLLMERLLGMKPTPGRAPSSLFSAMREFSSVREFFTASTIGTLADLPFLVLFLFLVASIGGNLVWVVLAGGALMVVPGFLFQKRMIALTQATQGAQGRATRLLHEAIYDHETVATTRGADRVARIWDELTTLSAVKSSEQRKLAAALTYWAQMVQQGTYVAAVVIGAYKVFAGDFTVGSIIAVGILTSRTLAPLTQLAGTLARWSNVKAALQGLDAIANAEQMQEEGRSYLRKDRLSGAFELRQLGFRYDPDGAQTIEIAGLSIPAGQRVAILGSNGSGKSTLLKVLAGIYAPETGRILLDGVDIAQIHPRDLRRNLGYLGQDVRLFAGSLRENLDPSQLDRDEGRLLAALDFAGLGPFVRSHPHGLDLQIRDGGEGLSVGQRQSIGWARLWLQDPGVVILDEPTAALDTTLETTLVSRLDPWLAGRTAIIATHRVPILALTSRTVILQNGRPAVDGPRDAVLAHLNKARGTQG